MEVIMDKNYKYDAFITYRHLSPDKPIAEKLQKLLEGYVPPKGIGKAGQRLHLFRDQTELPTSDDLGTSIREALAQSRYLIVVCSSETEKSRWCMEEIEFFKSLHGYSNKNILTLLCSPDGTVTFPETLRYETVMVEDEDGYHAERREIEPLAANVSAPTLAQSQKKLKTEFLRLAAALYGCSYDELYRRDQRRQSRRRVTIAVTVAAILALISLASIAALFTISSQKTQIENDIRELNISQAKSLVKESVELEKNGDLYGALASSVQSLELSRKESIPMQNAAVSQATKLSGAYQDEIFTAVAKFDQKDAINDFVMLDGGKRLFSTDYTNSYLWDVETGKKIKSFAVSSPNTSIYKDSTIESGKIDFLNEDKVAYEAKGNVLLSIDKLKVVLDGKKTADNAVYYIINDDESKKHIVCKINPEDGNNSWEYDLKNDCENPFATSELSKASADGITVITDKKLLVLSPKDGSLIASADINEIEKQTGEQSMDKDFYYQNDHLAVCYIADSKTYLALYARENNNLKFMWRKQINSIKKTVMSTLNCRVLIENDRVLLVNETLELLFAKSQFYGFNINDGSTIFALDGSNDIGGGKIFLGSIPKGKNEKIDINVAFGIVGNQFMAVNPDNGKTISNMILPENVLEMRFSENGYIIFTDAEGNEIIINVQNLIANNTQWTFFQNKNFGSELKAVSSCNGVYAVTDSAKMVMTLYRTVKNKNAKPMLIENQKEDEYIIYDYYLSPGKTKGVIKQKETDAKSTDPYTLSIIDTATNSVIHNLSIKDNIYDIQFINDEKFIVEFIKSLQIYDTATGKLIKEFKKELLNSYAVCSATEKMYYLDSENKKIYEYNDKFEETVVFDAKENDIYSIYKMYVSPDGSRIALEISTKDLQHKIVSIALDNNDKVTLLSQKESIDIKAVCWSTDSKELRMLIKDSVYCFDCETGDKNELPKHNCNIENIVDIDGSLCLLDIKSDLIKISKENGKYTEEKSVNLNIEKPGKTELTFTPYSDNAGLFSYGEYKAWLFDKNSFEIITPIEDCTEINTDTNEIIICYDGKLTSYPLLSAEETCDFAKDILVQTDEE